MVRRYAAPACNDEALWGASGEPRACSVLKCLAGRNFAAHFFFLRREERTVEMTKINSGKLRAIGYDPAVRILQVQLEDGTILQYGAVGEETWRRLSNSAAAWSFYRDNIEEEFAVKRVSGHGPAARNSLDDLFRKT
jgi:hypothetical protein